MTPNELLGSLRAIELRLSTSEVNSFFRGQDEQTRQNFVDLSLQVSIAVTNLTTANLNEIAGRLEALAPALQAGMNSLQTSIVQLNSAIAIVSTLSSVLGMVARVVAL